MKKYIIIGITAFLLLIIGSSGCSSYNKMVSEEENVAGKWAQVENAYQRRSDLIPSLVSVVEGVAGFEKSTLTDVINARASATQVKIDPSNLTPESLQMFEKAQGNLGSTLSRLMVVVEKYPELKATENFTQLQTEIAGTENRISIERKTFNEVSQGYNTYIRLFPKNVWAGMFGFEKKAYFEADKGSNKAPKIKFHI